MIRISSIGRKCRVRRQNCNSGERISARVQCPRRAEGNRRGGVGGGVEYVAPWRIAGFVVVVKKFRGVIEDSEACANRRLSATGRVPHHAQTRRPPVVMTFTVCLAGIARVAGEEQAIGRIDVNLRMLLGHECGNLEVRHVVVDILRLDIGLVAYPQLHKEVAPQLPIVCNVSAIVRRPVVIEQRVALGKRTRSQVPQKEIGVAEARIIWAGGVSAVESRKTEASIVRPDVDRIRYLMHVIEAERDLVPSANPVHVVLDLKQRAVEITWICRTASHAAKAARANANREVVVHERVYLYAAIGRVWIRGAIAAGTV